MLSVPTGRIEKSFRTEECCDFDGLTQIRKVNKSKGCASPTQRPQNGQYRGKY